MYPQNIPNILNPTPRSSAGLNDAYTDILGGGYWEQTYRGNLNGAVYPINASNQIIIPASAGGGNVVNVYAVYQTAVYFKWSGFYAAINSNYTGDSTNYLGTTVTNEYNATDGEFTVIQLATGAPVAGTNMQVIYASRSGARTLRGQSISGYPDIHLDAYQGTANDGDNYLMAALAHATLTTGNQKYQVMANKIGNALLAAGSAQDGLFSFALPLESEGGQVGYYDYNGPTTTWSAIIGPKPDGSFGNCLNISTDIPSGGYAGFGAWPAWPVSAANPFEQISFSLYGDGSSRFLVLGMNTSQTNSASGNVGLLIPLLPSDAGKFVQKNYVASDFWITSNVVYDSAHVPFPYSGVYGSNVQTLTMVEDVSLGLLIENFYFDFTGNGSGYAGVYFGAASSSSAGTAAFNFDIYCSVAGTLDIKCVDSAATPVSWMKAITVAAGWNYGVSIPWNGTTGFSTTNTFTHPATEFKIEAGNITSANVQINNARYDAVISMSSNPYTVVNGYQLSFPSNTGSAFDISFADINFQVSTIDGPASDPLRYAGIPRWTYKWVLDGVTQFFGSWRGPSSTGYSWLSGWLHSGISNPVNGRLISDSMMNFMEDSQNAYVTQFPAKQIGPFIPRYGRSSWEAVSTPGYVGGVYQASSYNQWYYPVSYNAAGSPVVDDDWYGYMVRSLLSVARYYYYNPTAQAKTILANWMAWLNINILANGTEWNTPSDYYSDGTVGYTYRPVYSHACIAQACMLKYFVDGDTIAQTWYRRLLDDMFASMRLTGTGGLAGIYPTNEGANYTTASVVFTVNSDATAPVATAFITGGKITHYTVTSAGSGITSISFAISGDGSGATGNAYLSDILVGAFSANHTGWEASEIYNTYALLLNGPPAGGVVNFPLIPGPNDTEAFDGMMNFYIKNTGIVRPSMLTQNWTPFHEYAIDPYHNGLGIEGPLNSDSHVPGAMWTETLGPTVWMAVEFGRRTGNFNWLDKLHSLLNEFQGN